MRVPRNISEPGTFGSYCQTNRYKCKWLRKDETNTYWCAYLVTHVYDKPNRKLHCLIKFGERAKRQRTVTYRKHR